MTTNRASLFVPAAVFVVLFSFRAPSALAGSPAPDLEPDARPVQAGPMAVPQYFTLNLPAGVSLVSSPLNTGKALARDAFLGLPPKWPFFLGWDPNAQEWVNGDQAPMSPSGGYWVFAPTPMALVVAGQPYGPLQAMTSHAEPGWHLFGVPFAEGIYWKDFKLYASSSPVSLGTAVEMGWIDADVSSLQGSTIISHAAGKPFQPGWAYWIKTNIPLDVRAERLNGPAMAAAPGARDEAEALAGGTSSSVMGWLGSVSESLVDVAKGAAQIAEGHIVAGLFEFAAGGFGLIEHALGGGESGSDIAADLSQIEGKLDTLIANVSAIDDKLTAMEAQISGLKSYLDSQAKLGQPVAQADVWLDQFYANPYLTLQSLTWARWALAGCDGQSTCPDVDKEVTADKYQRFAASFATQATPGVPLSPSVEPNSASDNFPVWWAYGVIGNQAGGKPTYTNAGTTAWEFEDTIYHGLTDDMGRSTNALMSYMEYLVSQQSACLVDISDPGCDLFGGVYQPLELFFVKAIGTQAQLVSAQVEAWNVLGARKPASYGNGGKNLMINFNQNLNQEAEAFLQVVEQLALYRAADGRQDWGNFGSTDAGQALARADFLVAQLAGTNYLAPGTAGNFNPPWPSSAVVGRVFYVDGEPALASTSTRNVCLSASGAFCATPVFQVGEFLPVDQNGVATRMGGEKNIAGGATGDWPYLKWSVSSGDLLGAVTREWTVQRLKPWNLPQGNAPNGLYLVNSTSKGRLGANLTIATYDSNYDSVASTVDGATWFGSFNAIEGPSGRYALGFGQAPWTASFSGDTTVHSFTEAVDGWSDLMTTTYKSVVKSTNSSLSATWLRTAKIKIDPASVQPTVHVRWPGSLNANIEGYQDSRADPFHVCTPAGYWTEVDRQLQLVGSGSKPTLNLVATAKTTDEDIWGMGDTYADESLEGTKAVLVPGTEYTFQAKFSSSLNPYQYMAFLYYSGTVERWAVDVNGQPSHINWRLSAPLLTVTK